MTEQSYRWIWVGLEPPRLYSIFGLSSSSSKPVSRPLHMALVLPWVFVFTAQKAQRRLGLPHYNWHPVLRFYCPKRIITFRPVWFHFGWLAGNRCCKPTSSGLGNGTTSVSWPLPLITFLFLLMDLWQPSRVNLTPFPV